MMRRSLRGGLTLVEVLVALAVLAVNVAGWTAALQLLLALVRGIAALTAPVDVDEVVQACALAALAPWRRGAAMGRRPRQRFARRRRGVTLVEALVALTIGAIALGIAAAIATSAWRVDRDAQRRAEAHVAGVALPALLAEVVQPAGRGLADGACGIEVTHAAERLVVRSTGSGGAIVVDELFAGRDAAGRQALYLRRLPHARQPWIEDVTAFRVVDVIADHHGRVVRVGVELMRIAPADPHRFDVDLPHRPCAGSAP